MDQVKIFEGYLPQILLCPFLNTLTHIIMWSVRDNLTHSRQLYRNQFINSKCKSLERFLYVLNGLITKVNFSQRLLLFHFFPDPLEVFLLQEKTSLRILYEGLGIHQNIFNPLSANPTKWSSTLKQFFDNGQRIVRMYFTIFWEWRLKVYEIDSKFRFQYYANLSELIIFYSSLNNQKALGFLMISGE